jgi:UDP-N-acetylmuramyl-tripeptide synthetase
VKLNDLLQAVAVKSVTARGQANRAWEPLKIESIHCRAQEVQPGGLFVAVQGFVRDGHDFIDQAIAQGAAAVVVQQPVDCDAVVIQVADTRRALALLADRFFGHPSWHLFVIGITGTNGKTTTAYLLEQMLVQQGFMVGVIGTINYRYAGKVFDNPVTTPESFDLQRILAEMVAAGITHVVMEVSSHAIDLSRIAGCAIDIGVFTNLSQDHLDYHGDMDTYWACKQRLFTEYLPASATRKPVQAVINADDAHGRELAPKLAMPVVLTGQSQEADVRAQAAVCDLDGIQARLQTPQGAQDIQSTLIGPHNLENILSAVGVGLAAGLPLATVQAGIHATRCVPGRLEKIPSSKGRHVYVDYAHTPAALEKVLLALKALARYRIICVFGCGGDRDRTKRPQMGSIAVTHSDVAVITSDNPRNEAPVDIIDQIVSGITALDVAQYQFADLEQGVGRKGYIIEVDRKAAIKKTIAFSQVHDTILIAGKGHETYQILGPRTVAFDDREHARRALETLTEMRVANTDA